MLVPPWNRIDGSQEIAILIDRLKLPVTSYRAHRWRMHEVAGPSVIEQSAQVDY